jgi:hypothetical protein
MLAVGKVLFFVVMPVSFWGEHKSCMQGDYNMGHACARGAEGVRLEMVFSF